MIQPIFLWAIAAVGIPLLLHLSRRRRFKEMPIGTLRFLRDHRQQRRMRARFEEILLLLLRVTALILLALVFVRPLFNRSDSTSRPVKATLILLDASGSITPRMADAARRAAKTAIGDAGGSQVTLAAFSDQVAPLESLEDYQPRAGAPSDFTQALEWALDQLELGARENARIVLIGHLSSVWLPVHPPRVWPARVAVDLVPLDPPSTDNAAVRDIALLTPFVSDEMAIEARVIFPAGIQNREVQFEAEGILQSAEVPAGADRVTFRFRPPREEVRGRIFIDGNDAWPADDSRPFLVRWTLPQRVLLIDGLPGGTPFDGQAYFIGKALAASGAAHGMSQIQPEIRYGLEGRQGLADLGGFDAVALCGVTDLTPDAARSLAEFVAKGGGLIHFLDERWSPAATASLAELGLFPDGVRSLPSRIPRAIVHRDEGNPALREFDPAEGNDLRSLPWLDAFELPTNGTWKSIATLDGGHPAILEMAEEGRGHVIVVGQPMTRAWTEIPREPLFVPLMKNLFSSLARLDQNAPTINRRTPGVHEARPIGIYENPDGTSEVVTGDPDEPLVASAPLATFREAFAFPSFTAPPTDPAEAVAGLPDGRSRVGEWWPWLAVALLLLLIVENIVATRRPTIPVHD